MEQQVPSWHALVALIKAGREVPVRGLLEFSGEMDDKAYPLLLGGVPQTLTLAPGTYVVLRHGEKHRIESAAGRVLLTDDGTTAVHAESSLQDGPVDVSDAWRMVRCPMVAMLDDNRMDSLLALSFPAGEIHPDVYLGRPCWNVTGLPSAPGLNRLDDPEEDGGRDTWASREMTVDAVTGAVLRLTRGHSIGQFIQVDLPSTGIPEESFRWDSGKDGAPRPPEILSVHDLPGRSSEEEMEEEIRQQRIERKLRKRHPLPAKTPEFGDTYRTLVESMAVAEPDPLPEGRRSLQVWIGRDDLTGTDAPRLIRGETTDLRLAFTSTTEPSVCRGTPVTVVAYAEPGLVDGVPVWRHPGQWRTILRGDGWCAEWWSEEPVHGYVRVTGRFVVLTSAEGTFAPTRATVHRIRMQCHEEFVPPQGKTARQNYTTDVLEFCAPGPTYCDPDRHMSGSVDRAMIVLDLDRVESPTVPVAAQTSAVDEFLVQDDPVFGDRFLWWIADRRRPVIQWVSLTGYGDNGDILPAGFFRSSREPLVLGQDPEPGRLRVICGGECYRADRRGRLSGPVDTDRAEFIPREVLDPINDAGLRWDREADGILGPVDGEVLIRAGDWLFSLRGNILVRYDPDRCVVQRRQLPVGTTMLRSVGPWIGCLAPDDTGSTTFQLRDPVTFEIETVIPVASAIVCTQWVTDELWIADGTLRIFRRTVDGEWTGQTVSMRKLLQDADPQTRR